MNRPESPPESTAQGGLETADAEKAALASAADSRSEQRKVSRIDRVVERLRRRLGDDEAAGVELFVRRLYGAVTTEDVLDRSEADLAGAALSLWRLAERRTPGEATVRVFNPDAERDGWTSAHTVVELVNDDMPFLVSSVTTELQDHDADLHLVLHPVFSVRRGADGRRREVYEADVPTVPRESLMHIEIDRETTAERLAEVSEALASVLADVRRAVDDWRPMVERVEGILREIEDRPPPVEAGEVAAAHEFLSWLADGHFTFLGYREYDLVHQGDDTYLRLIAGSGLGLLRTVREDSAERSRRPQPPAIARFLRQRELLIVTKTHARSPVHRPVAMDYIAVRRFDDSGRPVAERRFLGLFSSSVYHRSVVTIPLLAQKVQRVLDRVGFQPQSHDARTLRHLLETFPRDELFQISDDELYEISLGILRLQERQRVALFIRKDPFERFVSALVYVPRDRHSTALRRRIEAILAEACGGTTTSFSTQVGDQPLARAHYIFQTQPGRLPALDVKALERRIADEARTWGDRLRRALVEAHGEETGLAVLRRYEDAFPGSYRESLSADDAVADVERVDRVLAGSDLATRLYRPSGAASHEVRFKVFHPQPVRDLSDLLPILEDMGLRVVWEVPYEVRPADGGPDHAAGTVWIRDFLLAADDRIEIDLTSSQEHFRDAFERVWRGELESDLYNRLVVAAGLDWREVTLVRAYGRYLQQTGIAFSQGYMAATLARHPQTARAMVELFRRLFDPELAGEETDVDALKLAIRRSLAAVSNLDEDRILRRFLNLVRSTKRTNFFRRDADGAPKPYLSFKLDGRKVGELPEPRPRWEVWVYSPRMEGVHLRGGRVARGGIRWSDRPQDFRTEVLGLVKAQMVKNAVIVPVGAKGGFIVKRSPDGLTREQWQAEGVECYRTLIRGLLDLTDNLDGDRVVAPQGVVRLDGDDPYLVVAADKGTATFSDVANAVAAEYGFWLGDAFASGGSAGYDHKAMGITARGAWVSVERHFRELGVDVHREDFTVVGVGDMSGDVFGNGMLLSPHIRLVGAFNHLHLFVDPEPDPALSFAERQRLFALPRSTWADYDAARLSPGGAVFERGAKSLTVSPEVQRRFALAKPTVTPDELVKAMLSAEVDLLWFGGIGTFVKARDESHGEAGDRVNDYVRVDAADLGARVVGEGANLGVTQRGRIEYAARGGRINTDAIDNSAGVDTSDHEVNIKILLGEPVARGELDAAARNRLLAEMTGEVADLVLRDNYLQTQAISVAESQGPALLDQHRRLMRHLERAGRLVRAVEQLPSDDELAEREAKGLGLTRPELAVLLAYAKIALYQEILRSDLPDDPELERDLVLYFPEPLRQRYRAEIGRHRLRREIIATHVTNSTVNRVGPAFVARLMEETGAGAVDVARAYTIVRDAFGLRRLWGDVEELDHRVPAALQIDMIREVGRLVERSTLWLLRHARGRLEVSRRVAEFGNGAAALLAALDRVLPAEETDALARRTHALTERGVPEALARFVAGVDLLGAALDLVALAAGGRFAVPEVAGVYFRLGARFRFDWLRAVAARVAEEDHWSQAAAEALVAELDGHQRRIVASVLAKAADDAGADRAADDWLAAHGKLVEPVDRLLAELAAAPAVDLAMLTVADHQLRQLAQEG